MMDEEAMRQRLKATLSEHRYIHSLGVMETAVKLASLHGGDTDKCRLAGLLHDCAKSLSTEEMLSLIRQYGITLYPDEENHPALLHAPAGVAVARRDYGIEDEEILSAIRCHTVGSRHMSLTDEIIFVADFIEPGRKSFAGLEEVRLLAGKDVFAAGEECKRLTREYCLKNGQKVFAI